VTDPLPGLAGAELLLVASYGRAGSSRLMEVMQLTRAATVLGPFPFENRSLQFGALCFADAGTVGLDGSLTFDGFSYPPPVARDLDESEGDYRQRVLDEYGYLLPYALADLRADPGGPGLPADPPGPIVAEKSAGLGIVEKVLTFIPASRCVVLDRDPRDVFVSVLQFNQRRGFVSFGAEDGTLRLAQRIAEYYLGAADLVARWPGRASVVDYAQLIGDPLAALRSVTNWEGRSNQMRRALTEVANPDHVTAASTKASVGRWRRHRERWAVEFAVLSDAHRRFTRRLAATGNRPDRS